MLGFIIDDIIKRALSEDINYIDATTGALIDPIGVCDAVMIAKQDGCAAGVDIASRVFELLDPGMTITKHKKDSDKIRIKDKIITLRGKTSALLQGERTALNFLQHMSGIATATAECVQAVKGTNAVICDTRKTLPGLRALQKYAVTTGGGKNHRYNLCDAAMIKDNHIEVCGSISGAVKRLRAKIGHTVKIEVEVNDLAGLEEALDCGVDIIMLDNMNIKEMTKAAEVTRGRALLEASGNITLANLKEVARTGVDIISLGSLTHSVKALDISMKINMRG